MKHKDVMKRAVLAGAMSAFFALPSLGQELSEVCEETSNKSTRRALRQAYGDRYPIIFQTGTAQEISDWVLEHRDEAFPFEGIPWLLQGSAKEEFVDAAWKIQVEFAQELVNEFTLGVQPVEPEPGSDEPPLELTPIPEVRDLLVEAAALPKSYSQGALDQVRYLIYDLRNGHQIAQEEAVERFKWICPFYLNFNCASAVRSIVAAVTPTVWDYWAVSLLDDLEVVLSDPRVLQALAGLAVADLDRDGRWDSGTDLYSDLKDAFLGIGVEPDEAESLAWSVLAFYASRGSSIHGLRGMLNEENYLVFAALEIITGALAKKDLLAMPGRYSLPEGILSECTYGAPYHFWMGAVLGRHLRNEGYSKDATLVSIHLIGVAYELAGPVWSNMGLKKIFKEGPLSPRAVNIRKDIAFNDLGAWWGMQGTEELPSVDDAIERMNDRGRTHPGFLQDFLNDTGLMKTLAVYFPALRKFIAPDAHLSRWRWMLSF